MRNDPDLDQQIQNLRNNIDFIANALELTLPSNKNYHDCRFHSIEISGDRDDNIFMHMRNYYHDIKKIQVKFCPICGFEGNDPPEYKSAILQGNKEEEY